MLASIVLLLLLSVLPAASIGDAVECVDVAVLAGEGECHRAGVVGVMVMVWYRVKGPLLTETHSSTDETPEAGAPPGPAGSLKVTETGKRVAASGRAERVDDVAGGRGGVHQPRGGERAGAGDAILVLDVGGVDGERVLALGGGQARQAADRVRVARDEAERDAAVDQVGPAVVGERQGARGQAAGVDRLAEGDVDGRDT